MAVIVGDGRFHPCIECRAALTCMQATVIHDNFRLIALQAQTCFKKRCCTLHNPHPTHERGCPRAQQNEMISTAINITIVTTTITTHPTFMSYKTNPSNVFLFLQYLLLICTQSAYMYIGTQRHGHVLIKISTARSIPNSISIVHVMHVCNLLQSVNDCNDRNRQKWV